MANLHGAKLNGRDRDRLDDLISHLPKRLRAVAKSMRPPLHKPLFQGDEALFVDMLRGAKVYGEYGMGASTRWVDANTDARIVAVDTAREWVDQTHAAMTRPGHEIAYVDVGPVGKWGKPLETDRTEDFVTYMERPFSFDVTPDCVLVDGRFRVACFLTALMRCAPGSKILFDDYTDRDGYHVVEEVVPPLARSLRQALFVVPERRDMAWLQEMRAAYEANIA